VFHTHKLYQNTQQMHFDFWGDAISLYNGHQYVSSTHVAIFRLVITRT